MRLSQELQGGSQPAGYVSFLSALVHHGVLVDGLASIQVASPDRAGPWEVEQGRIEYHLLPRDLWFGYREVPFEQDVVPVATPEKALLDWCWLAEELGLDPRLDEIEWSALDIALLDRLAAEAGISYRRLLPPAGDSRHDQDRSRAEEIEPLRLLR
jgi:hypothetical protein